MPYKVAFQNKQTHVRVVVSGTRRLGDAAVDAGVVGEQIVDLCHRAGIYRVLLVLNLRGRLSALDSYEIVNNSKEYGWSHKFRLAFVDTTDESIDDVLFTETVAVNRAYSVRAFTDETEALSWLLGQEP